VGRGGGPVHPGGGRPAGRQGPRRLRLWPVHRRAGRALRGGKARLHRHPGVGRHDRAPGPADQRPPARDHHGHPDLHADPARRVREAGARPGRLVAAGRHLRGRAVDRGDARGNRAACGHRCGRHLRPVRGDRAGRGPGIRRDQGWPAHLGGPLLPGGHRPGRPHGAARGRARRTGPDLADQAGHAGHPVPDPRPDPAPAGHRPPGVPPDGEGDRPQRRHDHPARRERVPDPDRGDRSAHAGAGAALPVAADPRGPPGPPDRAGRAGDGLGGRAARGGGRAGRAGGQGQRRGDGGGPGGPARIAGALGRDIDRRPAT
jgi:hypothetical protein